MGYFDMHCTNGYTYKNNSISLDEASSTSNVKRAKAINADCCKGWLVWCQTILRRVSHLLLKNWCLTATTANTFRQYFSLSRTSVDYSESFAQKTQTVLSTRVTRDEVKVLYQKVGHMIILWTDDLMSTVKRRLGPSKSSTDTQRAVNQYWI